MNSVHPFRRYSGGQNRAVLYRFFWRDRFQDWLSSFCFLHPSSSRNISFSLCHQSYSRPSLSCHVVVATATNSYSAATAAEYRTLFLLSLLIRLGLHCMFWALVEVQPLLSRRWYLHPSSPWRTRPISLRRLFFVCNMFWVMVHVLMSTPPFSSSYFSFVFVLTDSSPILSSSRFATCFEHW